MIILRGSPQQYHRHAISTLSLSILGLSPKPKPISVYFNYNCKFKPKPVFVSHTTRRLYAATASEPSLDTHNQQHQHQQQQRQQQQQQQQQHPWPEWITFVDRLKSLGYFPPSSSFGYAEINILKDPCLSFARDRFDLFRSFSKDDIQSLVECGCPIIQRKVINSAKRLRVYVGLEEKNVCDICSLKRSCDRAYVILGESDGIARMVDLMRLLLSYALDPGLISGAVNASSINQAESGSRRVLNLLISMTEASTEQTPREFSRKQDRKEQFRSSVKDSSQDVEKRKGDWTCSKCSFMNFSRNPRCRKCNEENPNWINVNVEMKKGDWKCLQCGVLNFAKRRDCFRCNDPRPPQAMNPGEWECSKCYFRNFRRNTSCLKCGSERFRETLAGGQDRN